MNNKLKLFFLKLIPIRKHVAIKYYYSKFFNLLEPEMNLLVNLVQKDDVVIDVGANRGVYSYALMKLKTKLYIFEPNPDLYRLLDAWIENKKNIKLYNIALSDSSGKANLSIPIDINGIEHDASASLNNNFNGQAKNQLVDVERLDFYNFDKIDFIKIDVEGHEELVLNGAHNSINKFKPILLIEIEQRHNSKNIEIIFKKILDYGYDGFFIHNNKIFEISHFILQVHQNINNFNSSGVYINNFLFLKKNDSNYHIKLKHYL